MSFHVHRFCRICGSPRLEVFLDLGEMPLVNRYLDRPEDVETEPRFPLQMACCDSCRLSQLTCVVDPHILYADYAYHSSVSLTFQAHCRAMAAELVSRCDLSETSSVVEIASNDGCMQRAFAENGIRVLGIEPAANLAADARAAGLNVLNRFWDDAAAAEVLALQGPADLIVATNVVAHVDDLKGFLRAVRRTLSPHGVFVFEVPYMATFLTRTEFDTTYHEHLSYFLLTPLRRALADAGLHLADVQKFAIHGGSIRVFAGASEFPPSRRAIRMLETERECGFLDSDLYRQFTLHVETVRSELTDFLRSLRARKCHVAAYGASAKGNVLLNFCALGPNHIDYIVDDTPAKQGTFSPGNGIPIVPRDHLHRHPPDYLLLLAWNFADELMANLPEFHQAGGRFILPIPALRVV